MPSYELDKRIRSISVSVTLLQEIEKYLLDQGESQRKKDSRIKYTATIYDKFGEEHIESFGNYHRSTLPNEAKRIRLEVHDYFNDFRIALSFSREAAYSNLKVQVVGNSAKEKTIGIANTIESQLIEHKNINFIFHTPISYILPGLLAAAVPWTIFDLVKNNVTIEALISLFFIFLTLLFLGLTIVKPYSVFDTNRNRQISSVVKWILNGLAGVFLFGLLATLVRKYLIGF